MKCIVYAITNITKHPDNKRLYVAKAGPWTIITGSEPDGSCHYKEGQLGFFLPSGSIVPDKLAEEMWVKGKLGGEEKNTVERSKRNGVWSEGLFYGSQGASWNPAWKEGDDVAAEVGVTFNFRQVPISMMPKEMQDSIHKVLCGTKDVPSL